MGANRSVIAQSAFKDILLLQIAASDLIKGCPAKMRGASSRNAPTWLNVEVSAVLADTPASKKYWLTVSIGSRFSNREESHYDERKDRTQTCNRYGFPAFTSA